MATSGGPKLKGIGRSSNNLVLCLDARDANSYAGEPTTNLAANSNYSGAALNNKRSLSNGGWGTTFDNFITQIEGPGGKTVRAYNLQLTGSTGSSPHAEGAPYEITDMDSQYSSLTSGNSYRVSAWAKVVRADGSSTSHSNSNVLYLTGTASLGSSTMTVGTEWTKISASFSISSTGTYRLRHYFYSCSVGDTLIITEPQTELKGYSTPYVYSSRSATDGWVDLSSGANDGTLTNTTGTRTEQYRYGQVITLPQSTPSTISYLDFDGTDDKITIDNSTSLQSAFQSSTFTIECVFKADSSQDNLYPRIYQKGNALIHLTQTSPFAIYHNVYDNATPSANLTQAGAGNFVSADQWVHITAVWEGDASSNRNRIYKNGELFTQATNSASGTANNSTEHLYLGASSGDTRDLNGQIALFRVYKKVLTTAEIKSNFNQLRSRFGL